MRTTELLMKIKALKLLCGNDEPLPSSSLLRLLLIGCMFVFSSYAQATSLPGVPEELVYGSATGSVILFVFGLCSLLVMRRRKPWVAVAN